MLTDLTTTPIAETLRQLSATRKSGDLQVRSGKMVKTVFFDHGRLVFAASNLKKDRLGEALVALGRITDEEFNIVSALMKGDRKRRFGEALIAAGVMDKNELGGSVARQVWRIALSLFELTEGAAAFEERQSVIPLEYMVSLSLHHLMYEGIRLMKNRELIVTGLGNLDRSVTLTPAPLFAFDPRDCTVEEKEILELAGRSKVTLRRLAWAQGGLAASRLRATYALYASGFLQDAGPSQAPQPVIQMETGMFLLSVLRKQPDPSGREAIRQEVKGELERSARMDRESWLKVAQAAPREVLIKALEDKMERYHALREAVGEDEQVKTDIEVIIGRASAMLRLTLQTAPPPPATDGEEQVDIPIDELDALSESEPPPQPPPPEFAAPTAPSMPAHEITPARGIMVEEQAAGPGSTGFEGRAKVEHLLMEAEVRMTVSDYANAVKVYEKLIQEAPRVAAYRMRYAIAMACYPRTNKQAERQFYEAMRLEPDNADYHYQFGLYYKAMKQRPRAIAEMKTAVHLNPRHKQAREELESLSPKDSALSSLKKLFR
jgi:tetratricopeptide (TPR) repeat protein